MFPGIHIADTPYQALEGADAGVLVTEWAACVNLDFARIRKEMKRPLLFDGRNAWNRQAALQAGLTYIGVGRS
jgi:UDPglucose 6-dehydrogenase